MNVTRRGFGTMLLTTAAAVSAPTIMRGQDTMKAYNIEVHHRSIRDSEARGHGWCFGLPPGITPEQWPLDRCTGYPLVHGFTLLLPQDYRCHGPDFVAVSFFSVALEHSGGETNKLVETALKAVESPADPELRRLWQHHQKPHPRLHYMKDILGSDYAAILLTEAEFNSPFCLPPQYGDLSRFGGVRPAEWLGKGSARAFWDAKQQMRFVRDVLGQIPDADLAYNLAISRTPRFDPNAGKTPMEVYDGFIAKNGYQMPFDEDFKNREWVAGHSSNHIGGTMRPSQTIPDGFGPFYVEFDEEFGGYNFGGGNAQLDFQSMKFDWACG
jgi:hypothetical protein